MTRTESKTAQKKGEKAYAWHDERDKIDLNGGKGKGEVRGRRRGRGKENKSKYSIHNRCVVSGDGSEVLKGNNKYETNQEERRTNQ